MNRRTFLASSLLAAPALLAWSSLPAAANATGSTLVEAPGLTASGAFDVLPFTPGSNGVVNMVFTDGPRVAAQFGPNAVQAMASASQGDTISILYTAFNQSETLASTWRLNQLSLSGARAGFDVQGLSATASALVGGDQYPGAGLAAMILAAMSAGSVLRGAPATQLQAMVRRRAAGGGMDFGLEVTVRA